MVNTTMIAFSVDVLAALCSQVGLIIQKLAHRDQESSSKSTKTGDNSPTKFPLYEQRDSVSLDET